MEASGNKKLKSITAPLTRRFAMCFNEYDVRLGQEMVNELNTQLMWMGSAMSIDEPKSPVGAIGNPDVAGDEKAINKYLRRHCEGGHPTTDLLRERIYAALDGALLGMEVDDIMSKHYSKGAENPKNPRTNDNRNLQTNDNFIIPVGQYIWNSMKRGSFSLGTIPSAKPRLLIGGRGSLAGMPGGYPTE
ncbi:hypothetical protein DFJ58DRAFT_847917 [Suillus subalutaceus]|uniref:uncharacterized protein n=1 Tax=Suillus subalutaceus TaxID=48586 RepID=UPI001B87D4CB|nr:uncharacterized protein DFJ58DRAFT_847917 [Suillus subalutaceus]KAG1832891.1 hypothetical protein DFJ58DRAFT_847917 [Suillus subalutaceus]